MKEERKGLLIRVLLGGVLGGVLAPAVVFCLGMFLQPEASGAAALGSAGLLPLPVTPAMARIYGPVPALIIQSVLGALLGGVLLTATLPFADDGRELVLNSLRHFLLTVGSFALLLWVCRWVDTPVYILMWVGILLVLYGLIWLGRYVGWYVEVARIRAKLGLAPGPSPLKWRETLPYLPFLVLLCVGVPVAARLCDPADVPVFSALLAPFLVIPPVGGCVGYSLGKRQGICPLYPLAGVVLYLPGALLALRGSALLCLVLMAAAALAGNLAGAGYRKTSRNKNTN